MSAAAPGPKPTFGFGPGFQPHRLPTRYAPPPPRTAQRVVYFHVDPAVNVTFQVNDVTHLVQDKIGAEALAGEAAALGRGMGRADLPPPPAPPPLPLDVYWADYYHADYYVPSPEMCGQHPQHLQHVQHPQHAQHAQHQQLCVHGDYGPVTVPMVSTNSSQPMPVPVQVPHGHVLQQIVDESGTLRHVILSPQPNVPQHLPPHMQHGPPPPPQHYGPANGGNGPQQFYGPPTYPPPHFHPHGPQMAPPPQHTPPHMPHNLQPSYLKSERAQRQHNKLKRKIEQRNNDSRNNTLGFNSSHSTPAPSPRKEFSNGVRGRGPGSIVGGTSSEGEGSSSAATSVQGDEEAIQPLLDYLSSLQTPQVTDVTSRSALVQWNTLREPEGSPPPTINGEITYELLLGEKGRYKAIYSGQAVSCRVQDLRPGTEYAVCLQAHVEEYTGAASGAAIVRTPPCEPGTPTVLRSTTRARNSIQLRWNSPQDNGSHILHYVLQYDEGKGGEFTDLCKPRYKQHNVQKLEESTRYRFRLAAVNEVGRGPWSEEVLFSTCGSPPSPPEPPVLVSAAPCSLLLRWERRHGDEEFTLQMEDEHNRHGFLVVYAGRDLESNCENLSRCQNYKFRLQANNGEGDSRWSEEVTYRTLPEHPAAPSKPTVKGKIHANSFKVRWDPPGDRGGTDIQKYTLEINSGNGFENVYNGIDQEAVCDRLSPGCAYQVRVSCVTEGGMSKWSDIQTITTEPVVPGVTLPPTLISEPRPNSLSISWQKPDYDGGSPILDYNVEMYHNESSRLVHKGKETECTIQELLPGRQYTFKVKSFNRVGWSAWSEPLHTITGAAPPDIPKTPKASAKSPYNVLVHWDEPECNGGPIIDYQLEMSNSNNVDSHFSSIYHGPQTSYEIKNLTPFTSYFFRVSANNKAGASKWSDIGEISTPGAAPGAPPYLTAEMTATEIFLVWQEPPCNGYPILHYKIDTGDKTFTTPGPILEETLKSLTPETMYKIKIQAVNEIGIGNYSPTLKVETLPPPPPPPPITCVQHGHNFLKLKWGEGKNLDFTQYIIEMQNPRRRDYQIVYEGTSLFFRVKKLQESTTYKFRICACNDAGGQGEFSEDYEFETTAAPPPSLKAPRQIELTDHSLSVEWGSSKSSEDQLAYIVQCSRTKDQEFKQVYKGTETNFVIEDLECGFEYAVRVCAEREVDGSFLHGAWSPALLVSIPALPPPPVQAVCPAPKRTSRRAVATYFMSDNHYAFLIIFGVFIISLLFAYFIQSYIGG